MRLESRNENVDDWPGNALATEPSAGQGGFGLERLMYNCRIESTRTLRRSQSGQRKGRGATNGESLLGREGRWLTVEVG